MFSLGKSVGAIALAFSFTAPAFASPQDNTAVIALTEEMPSFDAYLSTAREGIVASRQIFDTLIERDLATGKYEASLATAWRRVDDRTWEFDLREGVRFHNGDPFTADDVVFTLSYYARPDSGARSANWLDWIERVEKVNDFKVRIIAKAPFPAALEFVSGSLSIFPKAYFEKVGQQAFGKQPVGTGPFKLQSARGNEYVLARNAAYFGGAKGQAKLDRLTVRIIPDEATRIAEVIGGNVDWTWNISADQVPQLQAVPTVEAQFGSTLTIATILLDARGRASGENSPLKDVRVRQAINHAIDRKKIVETLLGGDGKQLATLCHPLQFGCDESAAPQYDYNPAKARELLAQAGYPKGFKVSLSSFRDRPRAEAVKAYLAAVGIDANLEMLQSRASFSKWREGKLDLWYGDWGSSSMFDTSASLSAFFNFSPQDGFHDAEIRDIVQRADKALDESTRKAEYAKAIKLAAERAYFVPMHTIVVGYAADRRLAYRPSPDGIPRFYQIGWASK